MTRLAEMFNVNHFIVSQVNPHVVPFLAKEEEIIATEAQQTPAFSAGPTWIHNLANLAKGEALHRLHVLSELGVFPNYLTKARSVLNQRYSGDITIFPSISYAHFPKVLSNPTTEFMLQCMLTGERATWPKLSRIQNHLAIELALDETIRQLLARVVFSPGQIDLRLTNSKRPVSQGSRPGQAVQGVNHSTYDMSPSASSRQTPRPRVRLAAQGARPYLPNNPSRMQTRSFDHGQPRNSAIDAFSSSTNPDGSSSDGETSADTDTSELLSSPSPSNSPSSATPTLWPSTRQLFPYASQPTTPMLTSSGISNRSSSLLNLTMTSKQNSRAALPSSPELRYKRLFHPPPEADGDQPLSTYAESVPETQSIPPAVIPPSDSVPDAELRQVERERRNSRHGSVHGASLGLVLDISGTRGMMLRRKHSSRNVTPK